MAIDDGPIGRFTTGMPTAHKTHPDVPEKATLLDPEVVAMNSNEDEDADKLTDLRSVQVTEPGRTTRIWKKAQLFPGMRALAAQIGNTDKPVTFKEALEDLQKWHESIADEYRSHKENGTWKPAKLPLGGKALSTKWVFKIKTNPDDSLRYKSRLVVRGFEQREGIDFQETFAPVAKFLTVRVLLALATYFDWEIEQMDVKTAFLYPTIEEEVYIAILEGYWMFYLNDKSKAQVFQLVKTLYGLRQSLLAW